MPTDKKEYNVLVIEDNPGDFALVEEFLLERIETINISHAKSFSESREILSSKNHPFDIVLLDLSLPDKTGMPLIQEVIESFVNTPVIVLTGYSDFDFATKSLSLGISDYILKDELTSISLYKSIIYSLERKRAISALEESEKRYSDLFHLSPLPMFVFELESYNFLDVNDAFIKQYGYTKEEILGMNAKQIRSPEGIPAFEAGLLNHIKHQNNSLGIFKHLKKNGEIIQVDIQSNIINYKGKKARVTIASDVTESLNYIKAIEDQNEKLREISWLQSHVVRAPLARLMGLISLMKDTYKDEGEDEKQMTMDYLLLSANELDDVIKNITDKTRIPDDYKP